MQIALPELTGPATLILDPEHGLSDEEYVAICEANPSLRLERTAQGEIIIVPPAGGESDSRSVEVIHQLAAWAKRTRMGRVFGSSAAFFLPDGSVMSPDSAWISNKRLSTLSREQRREFLRVTPEFVVEVMSPSDRLPAARRKMRQWIANGVELGWLIDGDARCIYIFRQGGDEQIISEVDQLAGDGPVEGFVLELGEIWEGLS